MDLGAGKLQLLDWVIIFGYLAGLIGLSAWLSRGQHNRKDYYLGGNSSSPWAIALSTMATQCSTNSLLGVPAFVAFSGGLLWLQYEMAVPFAMIGLMLLLMPVLRGLNLISVYEFIERRFDINTRLALSGLFLLLRAFATGVTIYSVGLMIAKVLGVNYLAAVLILITVTVVYDFLGGMKAVIWSDVIQIFLIFGSVIAAVLVALHVNGGWAETMAAFPPERQSAVDFQGTGLGDGNIYSFWPMLFGGFFLYMAYYGCDQTQAQRSLATRSVEETNQALFIGGMLRFPLVAAYCLLGVAIGAYAALHPDFVDTLSLHQTSSGDTDWNLAVPVFILEHFPTGLIGLVLVGILGAAMSSLDSTLNSMSAVSMQDFVHRLTPKPLTDRQELILSKLITVAWGEACLIFSYFAGDIAPTVVEAVNKVGSLLNGPLLALFTMGIFTRFIGARAALAGLLCGLGFNAYLWLGLPGVSWLWYNVAGFVVAWGVGAVMAKTWPQPKGDYSELNLALVKPSGKTWIRVGILAVYGVLIAVGLTFI